MSNKSYRSRSQGTTPSYRKIKNLQWATLTNTPEIFKKKPRCKGARAKGYSYERLVGRRLNKRLELGDIEGKLFSGQWFKFADGNGQGNCQIDYYLHCGKFIILMECKLTQTETAEGQMIELYKPILEKIYNLPVVCVQVCKFLRVHPKEAILDIKDVISFPRGGILTWHYQG